jgi:hypothetical protein
LKVALEAVNSALKLVLLEDDLPELPLSELGGLLVSVHISWLEGIEGFVSDGLAEVNLFELLVELFDSLVNHVVKLHPGCHEARLDQLHFTHVCKLLRRRHIVEFVHLCPFSLEVICAKCFKRMLAKFHRDPRPLHLHVLES